ncbi:MAG: hypothetical protein EOO24_34530 [Comamonadaceae bacterium]|nr:MAG: hypothetical protein EOO24_34530 [Comamonadaceae bacterium]
MTTGRRWGADDAPALLEGAAQPAGQAWSAVALQVEDQERQARARLKESWRLVARVRQLGNPMDPRKPD